MSFRILFLLLLFAFPVFRTSAQCLDPDPGIWKDTWESCQASPNPNPVRGTGHWILYEFDTIYHLTKTRIWNTNEVGKTDRGFRNVIVDYSEDGQNWTELGQFEWARGSGESRYGGFEAFDFAGERARYVILTAIDNWGHSDCYGLAEVKFSVNSINPNSTAAPCNNPPCECLAPTSATAFTASPEEAWLLWSAPELAQTFTLRYRIPGQIWTTVNTDEPEYFIEDLESGQTYEFQIQSNCADTLSSFSQSFFFTTINEQFNCDIPISTSFFANQYGDVIVGWNEVPEAQAYRFRYRIRGSGGAWTETEVMESFIELEGLEEEEEYEYQISVLCPDGWTAYTSLYFFDLTNQLLTSDFEPQLPDWEVRLFPNPARTMVQLQINAEASSQIQIHICNTVGQVVAEFEEQMSMGEQILSYPLQGLTDGIYFVSIYDPSTDQRVSKRLIVVR